MKHLLPPATLLSATLFLSACGGSNSGSNSTKSFPITDFSKLDLEVLGDVFFEQGDSLYVSATGSSDLIEKLTVANDGSTLEIDLADVKNFSMKRKDLVIRIGSPGLGSIEYNSIGTLNIPGTLTGDRLRVDSEGAGEITIADCRVATFDLTSKGVGAIKVGGSANTASIRLEGVGTIDLAKLTTMKTTVVSKGVGDISVHAKDSLDLTLSGTGSIKYYGNPSSVKSDVSGLGKVTNMQ